MRLVSSTLKEEHGRQLCCITIEVEFDTVDVTYGELNDWEFTVRVERDFSEPHIILFVSEDELPAIQRQLRTPKSELFQVVAEGVKTAT